MNRIIKFRAWDKELKGFLQSFLIDEIGRIYEPGRSYNEWTDKVILMQFTGLLDKNKKEIYEGDIIKSQWGYGCPIVVVDLEDIFYWQGEGSIDLSLIEVIGNIYQNPELLEVNNELQ